MGNRAVIAFGKEPDSVGIYLHWNGGRASVEGFLAAAKELGVRGDYGASRLCQIICNWTGGTLSVDVGALSHLDCDNKDNGVYYVDEKFNIIGRKYLPRRGEEVDAEKTETIRIEAVARSKEAFTRKE